LSSFPYCALSSRLVLSNNWCNFCVFLPWISMGCDHVSSCIHHHLFVFWTLLLSIPALLRL
jgi:hypothetical protein